MGRTEVGPLVKRAIEANAAFADGFNVVMCLAADAADAVVSADPDRLTQVVTNLLSNAVKFSLAGQQVLVTIRSVNHRVLIGVRNYGPGIPEEFRSHMFEKFAQADTTDARRRGGSGLGLSIAHQIVTRMGGSISYELALGEGTIFTVDLPQSDPSTAAGAPANEQDLLVRPRLMRRSEIAT